MIILGIDPGSRVTGFGVIEVGKGKPRALDYGLLKPGSGSGHALRLARIHDGLLEVIDRVKPDVCAVEMPVYARNAQSMLKLGRVQAAAMLAAMNREVPVVEYTPKEVKKSVTGNGNATKKQVWFMLQKMLQITEDRGLDASDALAVGLCHSHRLKTNVKGDVTRRSWAEFVKANPDRIVGH